MPNIGYQPSTQLNGGLGHRGRNLWEDSCPCLSFPAGSPPLPSQRTADRLPTGGGVSSKEQGKKGVGFHRQDKPGVYYRHPINSLLKAERQGWDGSKSQLTGTHGCIEVRSWAWGLRWEYFRGEVLWFLQGDQEPVVPPRLGCGAGRVSWRLEKSAPAFLLPVPAPRISIRKKTVGRLKQGENLFFLEKERILAQLVRAWC